MTTKLTKKELTDILDSVTNDVSALMESEAAEEEAAKLTKADPGEEAPAEGTPEGSSTEMPPPAPEASAAPPAEEPPAEASPAPEMGAEATGAEDPAAEAGMTPEVLEAEYSKLAPEELKMHLLAAKSAYMKAMGGMEGGDEAAAPAAPAAPPPEASASPGPEMQRMEMGDGNGGQIKAGNEMGKSETTSEAAPMAKTEGGDIPDVSDLRKNVEDLKAENAKLEESVGTLVQAFEKTLNRPMRKAVTDIEYVNKPGDEAPSKGTVDVSKLSKSEVMQKLNEVTRASVGDLKKSDRDLIHSYCVGKVRAEDIAHLLQ